MLQQYQLLPYKNFKEKCSEKEVSKRPRIAKSKLTGRWVSFSRECVDLSMRQAASAFCHRLNQKEESKLDNPDLYTDE